MTKCGRISANDFDYTPGHIRRSIQRSLERLQTTYLDTVYLHDTEFVCTPVMPTETGYHATALGEAREAYGLAEGQESVVRGEGDQKILDAYAELSKMKEEGLIKHIGITGTFPDYNLRIYSIYSRLSTSCSSSSCAVDPSQPTLQARQRDPFILPSHTTGFDISQVRTPSPRACQGGTIGSRVAIQHGSSHLSPSSTLASVARGNAKGDG